jgi:hypothetical protein
MSLKLRKRLKLFPGLTLNFSKSGISVTMGIRGFSVNFGKKGKYLNIGAPGTGIYDRIKLDKNNENTKQGKSTLSDKVFSDMNSVNVDQLIKTLGSSMIAVHESANTQAHYTRNHVATIIMLQRTKDSVTNL